MGQMLAGETSGAKSQETWGLTLSHKGSHHVNIGHMLWFTAGRNSGSTTPMLGLRKQGV